MDLPVTQYPRRLINSRKRWRCVELLLRRTFALPLTPDPPAAIGRLDTRLSLFSFFLFFLGKWTCTRARSHTPRNPFVFQTLVVVVNSLCTREVHPLQRPNKIKSHPIFSTFKWAIQGNKLSCDFPQTNPARHSRQKSQTQPQPAPHWRPVTIGEHAFTRPIGVARAKSLTAIFDYAAEPRLPINDCIHVRSRQRPHTSLVGWERGWWSVAVPQGNRK